MISELALKISKPPDHLQECVGDTGIEPVTSSVSRKRSPTELIALCSARVPNEVETGFEPVYTALQAVASPLGHSTVRLVGLRADDGIRTRDPHLGKVMLYQLSHVRTAGAPVPRVSASGRLADRARGSPTGRRLRVGPRGVTSAPWLPASALLAPGSPACSPRASSRPPPMSVASTRAGGGR